MIAKLLEAGKAKILFATAILVVLTALADWAVGRNVSLGALYILPMMLAAVALRPVETAALAIVCSYFRFLFGVGESAPERALQFVFAVLAYLVSGLFVTAMVRNRELVIRHVDTLQVEKELRRDAEEQLRVLAESSPAAILTVDGAGVVLAANGAATSLFLLPEGQTLQGRRIRQYLPFLGEALGLNSGSIGLRTAAQCQGHRENGEIFLAHIWFSAYLAPEGKRVAAIVVDSSEEMREREEQGLRELITGNRIATAAIAHEVRNVCEAMNLLCDDLRERHDLAGDRGFQGLEGLVGGLEAIAEVELHLKMQDVIETVALREVMDNLRIVVEPDWREIDGTVRWHSPDRMPAVLAEPHGLLQAFLNLAQNSHRAVRDGGRRELDITIQVEDRHVMVRFQDSGPGIACPEKLFQPFQKGAAGHGLGLYISRSIVRNFGGDLRFEPQKQGSCFVVQLEAA